jgi:penicillin G amidase
MSRSRKVLLGLLVLILVLLLVVPAAGWFYFRRSLPQVNGTVHAAGLDGSAEITRDGHGIPYIYASTDHDAFFALGYVHAQDRLWQMEMQRRIAAGRLAEVLGKDALKTDQFLRTLGPYRAAQAALPALSAHSLATLKAYADGVNAYLAEGHPLPPEFAILGFKPQPWQPLDSLVWAKMMAWDLGGAYDTDISRQELATALGPERAAQLLPGYPADAPSILAAGSNGQLQDLWATRQNLRQLGLGDEHAGSNDWVVAGSRTASGKPLLANDPHLRAQIPSVWYLAGLHGDNINAVGATFPGLPAVVIGHNAHIAWGVTNLGPDVQDLYIERINPQDANQYEVNGKWVDMEIHAEDIAIKGQPEPLHWAARATQHGPLISDVTGQRGNAFALRWTALDPGDTTMDAFLNINYAANWDAFKNALRTYVAPAQNFVYADVEGHIGYFGPGHIPIRAKGDGSLPVPGWNDDYAWTGWIPFEQLPQTYNPPAGYVVTANNRVTPPGYPYFITNDWAEPYRAERITELLTAKTGLTPDDFARIQGDQHSAQTAELLPLLFQALSAPGTNEAVVDKPEQARVRADAEARLRAWDGTGSADSAAATIYETWFIELHRALLENKLGGDLADVITKDNPQFLRQVFSGALAAWCDDLLTPQRENCGDVARLSLDHALTYLSQRYGQDMNRWRWGDIHQTQFSHNPFSQVAFLKPFFHRSAAKGGDAYTVNPAPYSLAQPFDSGAVPSYREIIDLANFDNSRFMHTTGQSGHFLSPHYADLIPNWQGMAYVPIYWSKTALQNSRGTSTLTLAPG